MLFISVQVARACDLWCRSGKYVYKPTMSQTCCPQYPIRCDVASLRLTKSQKKVIKRVNQYLSYGERQTVTAAEPERHGREDVLTVISCHMITDDVKSPAALHLAAESTSASDAAAAGPSQSTGMLPSASSVQKTMHKAPKPGAYFVTSWLDCL